MSGKFYKNGIVEETGGIGENLILNSANLSASHLESGNEYIAINVGQSYMNVVSGTQVVVSFDLEIKIMNQSTTAANNTYFMLYNNNNKGPKQVNSVRLDSQVFDSSQEVGKTYKKRIYAITTIVTRDSPTTSNNYLEFYTVYGTGNVFKISNIKVEIGAHPTPWCPNSADEEYVGDVHGFIESGDVMQMYDNIIQTNDFIEY